MTSDPADGRRRPALLLVAHTSPPSNLVPARRVEGLTKYLDRLGYDVHVLTSALSGDGEVVGTRRVVRTPDLMTTRLNWRRGHFEALTGAREGTYASPSRLQSLVVPDLSLVTWLPFALPRALALARRTRFTCVITTSPPESAHAIGLALRRRGVPWIAELRDGWTFEPPRSPWPLGLQRRLDRRLERALLTRTELVVGVTAPIAEDVRDRLRVRAEVVTNGYDPEMAVTPVDGLLTPDRISMVYTGRLALGQRTPRPLFDALALLDREHPAEAARLELVLAGPLTAEERVLVDASGPVVRSVGMLAHQTARGLQRAADVLVVLTQGWARSVATGKLFEYLAAGRPILVLGDQTEAARIVESTRSGIATSATDPVAIADTLRRVAAGELPFAPDADAVAAYAYPALAARLAALVEEVAATGARSSAGVRSMS